MFETELPDRGVWAAGLKAEGSALAVSLFPAEGIKWLFGLETDAFEKDGCKEGLKEGDSRVRPSIAFSSRAGDARAERAMIVGVVANDGALNEAGSRPIIWGPGRWVDKPGE